VDRREIPMRRHPVRCLCLPHRLVCLFVYLFVGIKPEKPHTASCWERSKPPGSNHTQNHVHTKDSSTNHVRVNVWLTFHHLTGWLASLDLAAPPHDSSSATERCPPMPCMTYWFWTGGGRTPVAGLNLLW